MAIVLPGKTYRPEDLVRAAVARKWLILLPLVFISVGTVVAARFVPNRYMSEALILVVPQRVPETYVRSTVTTQIEDRIHSISQEILSRARLEQIVKDFGLYSEELKTTAMQDVVDRMRLDITVNIPIRTGRRDDGGSSFRVGYTSSDARKAMLVTERLTALFIGENLRDREVQAEGTDQFLETQLEEARQRLLENERRLEDYRNRYTGQLPSQLQTNLQVLQQTQTQLQTTIDSSNRDRDRMLAIDRLIADLEAVPPSQAPTPAPRPTRAATAARGEIEEPLTEGTAAEQLEATRKELRDMQLHLKPEHPDVLRTQRRIEALEKKVADEALKAPLSPTTPSTPLTADERARRNRLSELQAEKVQLSARLTKVQAEENRLKTLILTYQARIEATPARESELAVVTRDYETLQERYRALLTKREDAKIAADLERRQIGEQFKVIEPAQLPERPVSPNRPLINLLGALIGLGVGFAFAAVAEYNDSTIRTQDDALVALKLPVLAIVPAMVTKADRRKRRRRVFSIGAGMLMVAGLVALAWVIPFWRPRL